MRLQDFVLTYAFNSVWQVPLVCGMGWLASRLLERLGMKMQHSIWVIGLLFAALLPAAGMLAHGNAHRGAADVRLLPSASIDLQALPILEQRGVIALPRLAADTVLALYGMMLLASLSRFLVGLTRTQQLIRRSRPAPLSERNAEIWAHCRNAFFVGAAEVRELSGLAGPVTCGWRRALLLVPEGFLAACESDDLLAAFAHEAAHIERRDFLWNSLLSLVTLPIAYHPATWFLQARLAESRELICDEMASARLLDPNKYARSLFHLASRISRSASGREDSLHAIGIFDANILEKRMSKLRQETLRVSWQSMVFWIEIAVVLAGCVTTAAFALAPAVVQDAPLRGVAVRAAIPGEHVYRVGNGVSAPTLLHSVDPEYTVQARRAKLQGVCVLQMVIDTHGNVRSVQVTRPLGMGLDEKAIESVKQYRFEPALREGKPVAVAVTIEVNFKVY